jgi:predicted RNase H-like HicB family nuclease
MRYAILIEKAENNYAAYVPDVPGCVATGETLAEVKQQIQEALLFHLEGILEDSELIPEATTLCDYVDINIPIKV